MNCPHCGWGLAFTEHGVSPEGYTATLICNSIKKCEVVVNVSTNLLWAYENKRIHKDFVDEAYTILLSAGLIATPP